MLRRSFDREVHGREPGGRGSSRWEVWAALEGRSLPQRSQARSQHDLKSNEREREAAEEGQEAVVHKLETGLSENEVDEARE